MKLFIYNNDGLITSVMNIPAEAFDSQDFTGVKVIEVSDGVSEIGKYISADTVVDRPTMSVTLNKTTCVANGIDAINATGILIGAQVTLGALSQTATQSTAELLFDVSGQHQFKVELFPYLPFEVTIHAA